MRKLILQMQMSVDGYVSAANQELDWLVWNFGAEWSWDERLKQDFNRVFESIDCILLSRKMAEEGYLSHWGNAAKNFPANRHYAFAQRIVDVRKVVLTNKLDESQWDRAAIASGDMTAEITALKSQGGGNIITFGGVGFASALVAAELVDEFQFFVNPIAVGAGRSVFGDSREGTRLRLIQSDAYDCGIVVNRYAPGR
ncbi:MULTISPECIES: dihydrofolate reductase family protein [Paraburkholderia]|uniref:dihydrofolate reductase family protein n=1 Tax=Paraburkholderia TaxID=1822464 RepID=UPI00225175B6|nr:MULTISPECIES: dihydrofolate reductase family protein [Paraburkholderia]MCX4161504.1 dihydrofolate reductase family protein [Paraburkholderia megapolitana]MDN7157000.1 dihydrofolate reductase family protein [Paraburkholderia sp. CHISQ3]MDQ6494045.1 dihydrofolate reductase family protein [Paraburkholderia megapolitana]